MSKQWGGRFEASPDKLVEALGESVSFDARLALWDIRASKAHARMLGKQNIISEQDSVLIIEGLGKVAEDIEAGRLIWDKALEDVHTNIEVALVKHIGDAGKRLHTARSRNDQIATDVRLWCRDQVDEIILLLTEFAKALTDFAEKHFEIVLPGFTHLQHAQPVLLAHHVLAYVEMFLRDRQRFQELRKRVNIMPLGSAALAGSPYPINRRMVADELEFEGISANSMDAVADRDYIIEFTSASSLIMLHLSRMCEELILWSTPEFHFIEIGDAFTTGSSIMPQKKNPDVAELVRGKTGRVVGDLMALLTLVKGLPLTYNRDLQEDKEPLFDVADTVQLCLAVMTRMIPTIHVYADSMLLAAQEGFLEATDLADYLVTKGMPFREAHGVIGQIVLYCVKEAKRLPELTTEEYSRFSSLFKEDVHAILTPQMIVARRDIEGGTAPVQVRKALLEAQSKIGT